MSTPKTSPVAERMSRLGTETAFAVSAEANEWRALGHTVYPFHLGDMDLPTPENITEAAFRAVRDGKTGYCPNAGIPELREALAADVGACRGVSYGPQNVAVQPGGKPVIEKFLLTLMDPGDEVLYPSPGFPIYESQIEFLGGVAKPYGFVPGEHNFLLDFDAIEAAITPRTKLLIFNNLHNPTGAESPDSEIEALAELALAHDLYVLSDEAYWDVRYSGESRSIASLPGMAERTVILYTFSKKYAMTGWRLGGAIGPEDLIARIATLNVNQESCTTHFIQWAGLEALTGDQSGAHDILRVLKERRDIAVDLLNEIPGVNCYRPEATFYLYPDVTGLVEHKGLETYDELRRAALEQAGVSFCTRLHFGRALSGEDRRYVRLAYSGISADLIREGLGRLKGVGAVSGDGPNARLLRTPFHAQHVAAGARMVDFGGWDMPVQYPTGIIAEHLATRGGAGLFDVSHMGRFVLRGPGSAAFLQHVLTNNAEALDLLQAQYTMVPTETGGAVDDAYLYRFVDGEYLLVVNASNRHKDWDHFHEHLAHFPDVEMTDETGEIAMVALQGKTSRDIIGGLIESGALPEPLRNELSVAGLRLPGDGRLVEARIARTGYTGEPVAFELFVPPHDGPALWDALVEAGAVPVGLGARDTLRLEAGLPLYGHELGTDPDGSEIPIFSCPLATFAVSFSPRKGDFIGRHPLERQQKAYARILQRDYSRLQDLPRLTRPVAVTGRGIAREGAPVHAEAGAERFGGETLLGWITSGTAVPYWGQEGQGLCSLQTEQHELRSIALAYLDSRVLEDDEVEVDVRGRRVPGLVVPYHLRSDAPPCARAIIWDYTPQLTELEGGPAGEKALRLLGKAIANHEWRQQECIDLIPSEMTASPATRLLSITDPAGRYAEHKKAEAFYDADVFYYQGTGFIHEVERLLVGEFRAYLGCPEVETRTVSGQMANTAVFSALVDYLNRADRKAEPRRIAKVVNNHIGKGGHLSAQPMGALRDYVARNPRTELPSVVDIPVLPENPYKADVPALLDVLERERPELVILGKSMVLHPEPVYEVRQFLDAAGIPAVLMYDMAHVLGLAGPRFQEPFVEGADIVTGSTHKTFFGTQRGMVAARWVEADEKHDLWEAIERRTFPGSVSNHHLGTLLGLLMAAFEMNHFRDAWQQAVIANAKAFAVALHAAGLDVAGDPAVQYTETHQVVVRVGYGQGPEVAGRLEDSGIIVNYQAAPDEEGFTAAGALRLGVAEMTRFGMGPEQFAEVAHLMAAVILGGRGVAAEVRALRKPFTEMGYCFKGPDFDPLVQRLHDLI